MQPMDFCYWLQGFAEMTDAVPTETQWQQIKDHLNEVFHKRTPQRGWTDKGIYDHQPEAVKQTEADKKRDEISKALEPFFKKNREDAEKRKQAEQLDPLPKLPWDERHIPFTPVEPYDRFRPTFVPMTLPGNPSPYNPYNPLSPIC